MTKLKFMGAVVAATLFAATGASAQDMSSEEQAELMKMPSTEGVVRDAATCEYEGGTVMDVADGNICFISVRGVAANTKVYDGMRLGVIRCSGNGSFPNELVQPAGEYCRVYLGPKAKKKTREELEAEMEALTEAELARTN